MPCAYDKVNSIRGIVRDFHVESNRSTMAVGVKEMLWDVEGFLYEQDLAPPVSEGRSLLRSISIVLFSNRSLMLAWSAARMGYLVSYFDATGDRVKGFESEKRDLLHTIWVSRLHIHLIRITKKHSLGFLGQNFIRSVRYPEGQ